MSAVEMRARYARVAPLYDLLDRPLEPLYARGRRLIGAMSGGLTLELGAGTGKNFPYYTADARVIASDVSWARLRATRSLRAVRPASAAMMRAVAYNEELAGRVRAELADRTDVEEKKMFGGLTFMVAGQMCCGVLKNDLIVRIEPAVFDDLVAQPHVRPFDFSGRPMQGMLYVENSGLADPEVLRTWVQRGTEYVAAHPASPKGRKRG